MNLNEQIVYLSSKLKKTQERINKDKEILSTFYDLRNDVVSVSSEARLLPILKHYEEAYSIIINTLKVSFVIRYQILLYHLADMRL